MCAREHHARDRKHQVERHREFRKADEADTDRYGIENEDRREPATASGAFRLC